jgi:hypothetical protein
MLNKRQLMIGAGSVLATAAMPATGHENAFKGVYEKRKPFFEVLYVRCCPEEHTQNHWYNFPGAVYTEVEFLDGVKGKAFLGRFNHAQHHDGTPYIGWKIAVNEKVSFAARLASDATKEQGQNLLNSYRKHGMSVTEMPPLMLNKHLDLLSKYGPMNQAELDHLATDNRMEARYG